MDNQSEKKRAKLVELKNKLLDGQHIQNRQLKTWLGDDAFGEMEDEWKSQQSICDDLASPPAEIIEYKKRAKGAVVVVVVGPSKTSVQTAT